MAKFEPFRGTRYGGTRGLTPVLCPPYDVIPSDLAKRLRARRCNAVHLELPAGAYGEAGRLWKRWRSEGVLQQDPAPAFYLCEQAFAGARKRLGVFGALKLEKPGRGVLAHERTFPKPRAERMRQLKALKVNTSPVFGTFRDPRKVLSALKARRRRPTAEGRAPGGSRYRLWRVDDPKEVSRLRRVVEASAVLIADGHHRYRVAMEFGRRAKVSGSDRVLAYLVPDADPGLVVLPTHRLVPAKRFPTRRLFRWCRVVERPNLRALMRDIGGAAFGILLKGAKRPASRGARGAVSGGAAAPICLLAVPRGEDILVNGRRPVVDVEWVQGRLLKGLGPAQGVRFLHDAQAIDREVRKGRDVGVLLGPLSVPLIRAAVEANGLMPQKSTYFYPKVATGLVFRALGNGDEL